jgi:hypothetical protein
MCGVNVEKIQHDAEAQADWIMAMARFHKMRTGQLLFNNLPAPVANVIRRTEIDPFYKDLTREEVLKWYDDHIIYNEYDEIVVVFSANTILWERD